MDPERDLAPIGVMDFADALRMVKAGARVRRRGWNGRGMFIFLVPGSTFQVAADRPLGLAAPELVGRSVRYLGHIDMVTAHGEVVPWLASQTDILAADWEQVP
jgi:hypothetical protein